MITILVPVDFSENSLTALKFANSIVKEQKGEIILLHVTEPENLRELTSENLGATHLLKLWSGAVGDRVKTLLREGPIAQNILETANEVEASMIVMGTKGANGTMDRFIGSNASRVATKSEIPVLVIPESMPYRQISRIVIGVDPNLEYDQTVAWLSESLLQQVHDVSLFSAGSPNIEDDITRYQKRLEEIIHEHAPKCRVTCKVQATADTIASLDGFVKDLDADLLVLTTHHRGVFERIFDPGLTREFTLSAEIPILAIPVRKIPVYLFQ